MLVRSLDGFGDLLGRYDYTASLLPNNWAWEFARRNAALRDDAYAVLPQFSERSGGSVARYQTLHEPDHAAEAWGLHYFPDPDHSALSANVFWTDAVFPRKLSVHLRECDTGEVEEPFDRGIQRCRIVHLTDPAGRTHLRIKGPTCSLQLGCNGIPNISDRPLKLAFSVPGFKCSEKYFHALKQARQVFDADSTLQPWSRKTLGLRNALVALDAHAADMRYRDMAEIFYGKSRVTEDWTGCSNAMKSSMARLLAKGQRLRDGGYRDLLRHHV